MEMPTVLIVDDRMDYLNAINRALRANYHVITSSSLEDAKTQLINDQSDSISLAVIDICLKDSVDPLDRSGLLLVNWIAHNKKRIRTIAMSALEEASLPSRSLRAGAREFLPKPFDSAALAKLLGKISGVINKPQP